MYDVNYAIRKPEYSMDIKNHTWYAADAAKASDMNVKATGANKINLNFANASEYVLALV